MKKILTVFALSAVFSSCDVILPVLQTVSTIPTNTEVVSGLKEALTNGVVSGVNVLSVKDGFFKNPTWKIPLPEEVKTVESAMRTLGFGSKVDMAVKALNEGAEMATKEARDIFVTAIREMSIQDAMGILRGGNSSATNYLKSSSTDALVAKFRPVIEQSLEKVDALKYWGDVMTGYNLVSTNKINPDLTGYVTDRAITALFSEVEKQENAIRQDPIQRTSELLKKVFDYADTQK
jgi:hypothetical protein